MNSLLDYVFIYPTYSKSFCDSIIKHSSSIEWGTHTWTYRNSDKKFSYSEKELQIKNLPQEFHSDFFNQTEKTINKYIEKYGNKEKIVNNLSMPRINRYQKGSLMRNHIDHISYIFDGNAKGIPVLSLVCLLNDDFKGGEFVLLNNKYNLKQGDLLIFPSNFLYPHTVK
jgi:hypothetical protein